MRALTGLRAAVAGALLGAVGPTCAQVPPFAVPIPERRPEFSPLPDVAPKPAAPFVLPPLPPLDDRQRLSSTLRVFVKRFEFSGNTVFTDAELRALIQGYEGRELGNVEIEDARLRLTAHYIDNGYVSSGALLPDQDLNDGVLRFRIVEGRLSDIVIEGNNRFARSFLTDRIAADPNAPLKLPALQERLQLLAQNPLIDRLNAQLGPGERLGEAQLRVDVAEAKRYELGYRLSNSRSPSIGSYLNEFTAAARNLLGRGIQVGLRYGTTHGLEEYTAYAAAPVTRWDTTLSLRYEKNRSVVVEQPFGPLDIVSKSDTAEVGLTQPLYRSLSQEIALGAYYSDRENETFLLGAPFPFTPGVSDAHSRVRAGRLSLDWFYRTENQVFSARVWAKKGLDLPGVTINPNLADSQFVTRFVQAQYVRRLSDAGNQVVVRYDRQFANGKLLPSEKFALGGVETVRGYRENRLVKDQGWFASLEYRHPVFRWVPSFLSTKSEDGAVQLVAFTDRGRAYDDQEIPSSFPDRLASVGAGVRWDLVPGIYARFYYAKAMEKITVPNADPQDRGLHFTINVSKYF